MAARHVHATRATAALLAACVLTATTDLAADVGPRIPPGWYLPAGLNFGIASHAKSFTGAVLGAEASIVNMSRDLVWLGAYTDVLWDTSGSVRGSIGPELGVAMFGLDAGFAYELGNGRVDKGFVIRPLITFGAFAVYGRYGHMFNGTGSEDFTEFGILLKFPSRLGSDEQRADDERRRRQDLYRPPLPPRPTTESPPTPPPSSTAQP